MALTAFQVHRSWLPRAAWVLMVTVLADAAVVWFVPRPIFWSVLVAGSLPLSMLVFVAFPILRDKSGKT